jgi:hypothetical protein
MGGEMRGGRSAAPQRACVPGPYARLAEPRTRLSVGFSVATDASVPDRGSGGDETLPYDGATLPRTRKTP